MFSHWKRITCFTVLALLIHMGCHESSLSDEQARLAIEEAVLSSQAAVLVSSAIDLGTQFTIGSNVDLAVEELQTNIESQLPCAQVEVLGDSLLIYYGTYKGLCEHNGQQYSGIHKIRVAATDPGGCVVENRFTAFSNDNVSVSGQAHVRYSKIASPRQIEFDLQWQSKLSPKRARGEGQRTETALSTGFTEGMVLSGAYDWTSESDDWSLDIESATVHWRDSTPHTGQYVLQTPYDSTATMAFRPTSGDAIEVSVSSGPRQYLFRVNKLGLIVGI